MQLPSVPQRTTPGFAFSMVDRALLECLATRQFGRAEIAEVLAFFGADPPECVYCGSHDVRRWDHLVPVKEGGETVLGNMVPACARCDDSKGSLHFAAWMKADVPGSPKSRGVADLERRIARIEAYVRHFGYVPRALPERLDEAERARLEAIRGRLREVRGEIERLIDDYRRREGPR